MYRSWKNLTIKNENEVRSPERLHALYKEKSRGSILVIWAFALCVLLCMAIAILLIVAIQSYLWSLLMFVMAALFLWACKQFHLARISDPLLQYLNVPDDFEFAKGEVISADYISSGEHQAERRMVIEGKGKSLEGKELIFFEQFSPDMWTFNNDQLPIQVHILYDKKSLDAVMIGINYSLLQNFQVL